MPRLRVCPVLLVVMVLTCCCVSCAKDGNGVDDLPAGAILDRARQAASEASSLRVQGQLDSGGQPATIDLRFARDGQAAGVITMAAHTIELFRRGAEVYVKGSAGFYASIGLPSMPARLRGKYLKVRPGQDQFAAFAQLTDMRGLVAATLTPAAALRKGDEESIGGTRAIRLVERGGSDAGSRRSWTVALEGEPLPLRLTTTMGGADAGSINFVEYNQPFAVQPPAARDVVDFNLLTRGSTRTGAAA